jgi:D-alanyl-D-alanine carboxypeptidase (penicillin-binding protein 5/6)
VSYVQNTHSFDWKGFYFTCKVVAVLFVLGTGAHWGFLFAQSFLFPSAHVAEAGPLAPAAQAASISSTTPQRIINALTIADVVPAEGKFIAADLVAMKLYLYKDGAVVEEYPIKTKGRPGTPWETPSGMYAIQTKEENHFSTIGKVYMPYSMQFYGNYFIHGWTYYPDGTPTSATFSGGCIKLSTEDAAKVFAFADRGTRVFVYDSTQAVPPPPLALSPLPTPPVNAAAYVVADIDTGDVYAEQEAQTRRPIASVTKLMTALVANEIISLDKKVSVPEGVLFNPPRATSTGAKTFLVDDLFYPLLMQSSNGTAEALASYYGTRGFVGWMNTTAKALGMEATTYADASGASAENVSTPEDLFRLATYLANKKSFVLSITHTSTKTIVAEDGSKYQIQNINTPANTSLFEGGKVGHTTAAQDTMLSVLSFHVGDKTRRMAVIVLGSSDQAADTQHLAEWITTAAAQGAPQTACVSCWQAPQYRKIEQ